MIKGKHLKVIQDCKKNKSLIPLVCLVTFAGVLASGSIIHTITHSPDVHLNRWNIKEPYMFNNNNNNKK
jgi:hypothetical protein